MLSDKKICFIGAGSMAESILAGIIAKNLIPPKNITVINRSNKQRINELIDKYGISHNNDKRESINKADVLILGMKPKDVKDAVNELKGNISPNHLIISVIAGISTERIRELFQKDLPVIRTMPNTSSMIGLSATGITKGQYANDRHLQLAKSIMEGIGIVSVVEEKDLDIVTALSGSGPAYIYYMVEAMEKAAIKLGLEKKIAREFTIQTIIGAGHMIKETNEEPESLRKKVTSPGGTTMAGLSALEDNHFENIIYQVLKRASDRAKELGS